MNTVNCFELRGDFLVYLRTARSRENVATFHNVRIRQTFNKPFLRLFLAHNESTRPEDSDLLLEHERVTRITDTSGGHIWPF